MCGLETAEDQCYSQTGGRSNGAVRILLFLSRVDRDIDDGGEVEMRNQEKHLFMPEHPWWASSAAPAKIPGPLHPDWALRKAVQYGTECKSSEMSGGHSPLFQPSKASRPSSGTRFYVSERRYCISGRE